MAYLCYDHAQVSFLGLGGATIKSITDKLTTKLVDVVDIVRPEIVIVQLGTKELTWHSTHPDQLREEMR